MFQSSTGIEQDEKIQLALGVLLITIICGFAIVTKIRTPDVKIVNGVYRNSCCSDIIINNGAVTYHASTMKIRLLRMKFGLTGYVNAQFTRQGIVADKSTTAISFSGDGERRVLSLPVEEANYTFQRVSSFWISN